MTPEQEALRAAFLSECWAPVREWHPTDAERAAAWARTQVNAPVHQQESQQAVDTHEEREIA